MALSIHEQIFAQIKNCKTALIVMPENPSVDSITSALTLLYSLNHYGKKVTVVSWQFNTPQKLKFINDINTIQPDISVLQKSAINIDTTKYPINDISYTIDNNLLQILLSPKNGTLPKEAIEFSPTSYNYDIIFTINTVELPALGHLCSKYQEFFNNTPIINIDHKPDNSLFGQINWVNINATSTSEMMFELFYNKTQPKKDIATLILTGIMEETHSFRTHQVKPETLKIVSILLQAGAEHSKIVNNIYRTKTVGLLRLWGHVLDNIQADRELSLAWSVIPESIFASTGTEKSQLQDLMTEVLSHSPEAKTMVLFLEHRKEPLSIEIQVSTTPPLHAKDLIKNWQPYGSERVAIADIANKNLAEAEKEVIAVIKQRISSIIQK